MINLEPKEQELMDYLDAIVQRIVLDLELPVGSCNKREVRLIEIVGKKSQIMMTEIAEQAMLSLSTVTGLVDNLVAKSLVRRERSEQDRRVVRIELTDEGKKMYQQSLDFRSNLVHSMLASLEKTEQDALIALFRKISERVVMQKKAITA
jgi:DNA-binding MarR family transcriptional regulator